MTSPLDLTTLANVQQYLGLPNTTDTALLARLITAASAFAQNWINRTLAVGNYTETRNGVGNNKIMLGNYPVQSITSLSLAPSPSQTPQIITPATLTSPTGYSFDAKQLYLTGYTFPRGFQNVVIAYTAGYSQIPYDVEQAVIDIIALWYKRKDHVDQVSQNLGGQVVTFSQKDMPDSAKSALQPYKRVFAV